MPVCPICGSRWDSEDPFCPACSTPPEEREDFPFAQEPPENGKRKGKERAGGTERGSGPDLSRANVQESGIHAVVERKSVPPPRPNGPRPVQEGSPGQQEASGATAAYGSAVLALGEVEEEVVFPEEAPVDSADRPKGEIEPGPARDEAAGATNGARASRQTAGAEPEAAPRERSRDSWPPKRAAEEEAPPRPPVLASEALRKEVAPQEPGRSTMRVLLLVLGLAGSVSSLLLMRFAGMGVPLAGAFIGLTLLGLPPIPYAARAVAAVTMSACALGVVTWMNLVYTGSQPVIAEIVGLTILSAALFFRAWHRGSTLARFLVLVGLIVSASWLGMSGALSQMTTLDPWWQSWLPSVLRAPLGLLLMLSLLAFMDERSTGGCEIWATGALLWEGLNNGVQLLARYWPPDRDAPDWSLVSGGESVPMIASPLLTTLVAFGTAQLLAVTAAREATSAGESDEDEQ